MQRNQANPRFYAWLSSFLFCPDHRILATVPYARRYSAEREWTIRLRKTCDLFNISDGASPLKRGPLSEEHKAAIAATKARRRAELAAAAA